MNQNREEEPTKKISQKQQDGNKQIARFYFGCFLYTNRDNFYPFERKQLSSSGECVYFVYYWCFVGVAVVALKAKRNSSAQLIQLKGFLFHPAARHFLFFSSFFFLCLNSLLEQIPDYITDKNQNVLHFIIHYIKSYISLVQSGLRCLPMLEE